MESPLDFFADLCGDCRVLGEEVEDAADRRGGCVVPAEEEELYLRHADFLEEGINDSRFTIGLFLLIGA